MDTRAEPEAPLAALSGRLAQGLVGHGPLIERLLIAMLDLWMRHQ